QNQTPIAPVRYCLVSVSAGSPQKSISSVGPTMAATWREFPTMGRASQPNIANAYLIASSVFPRSIAHQVRDSGFRSYARCCSRTLGRSLSRTESAVQVLRSSSRSRPRDGRATLKESFLRFTALIRLDRFELGRG